jgi:hypothetical protein
VPRRARASAPTRLDGAQPTVGPSRSSSSGRCHQASEQHPTGRSALPDEDATAVVEEGDWPGITSDAGARSRVAPVLERLVAVAAVAPACRGAAAAARHEGIEPRDVDVLRIHHCARQDVPDQLRDTIGEAQGASAPAARLRRSTILRRRRICSVGAVVGQRDRPSTVGWTELGDDPDESQGPRVLDDDGGGDDGGESGGPAITAPGPRVLAGCLTPASVAPGGERDDGRVATRVHSEFCHPGHLDEGPGSGTAGAAEGLLLTGAEPPSAMAARRPLEPRVVEARISAAENLDRRRVVTRLPFRFSIRAAEVFRSLGPAEPLPCEVAWPPPRSVRGPSRRL